MKVEGSGMGTTLKVRLPELSINGNVLIDLLGEVDAKVRKTLASRINFPACKN
jgi:hypothetical protein